MASLQAHTQAMSLTMRKTVSAVLKSFLLCMELLFHVDTSKVCQDSLEG